MSGLFSDDTLSLYLKLKEAAKQYLSDAFGGSLNAEVPNYPQMIANQAQTQQDTLRDAWGDPNKMADATLGMMNGAMGSFLPFGITAWHGSPHKFDRFDLSKIGTGEGAQAYGHGLYLAESPKVAKEYQKNLSQFSRIDGRPLVGNKTISSGARTFLLAENADLPKAIQNARDAIARKPDNELLPPILKELESLNPDSITKSSTGQLYKTDIPDEAVARFLDWDKPLSEQAPEVQAALQKAAEIRAKQTGGAFGPLDMGQVGRDVVHTLGEGRLRDAGIPGIRYLDGGSRGAGTGTSNFVVFDPEMIRILERNGQPTGLQPWQPGEWEGLFKK